MAFSNLSVEGPVSNLPEVRRTPAYRLMLPEHSLCVRAVGFFVFSCHPHNHFGMLVLLFYPVCGGEN